MPTPSLLARITLALSAASVGVVAAACGGQTAEDGGGAGTSAAGTGGSGVAGTGGSGVSGAGGSGVSGAGGSATGCERALPDELSCNDNTDCQTAGFVSTCFGPGTSSCDGLTGPQQPTCASNADCEAMGFTGDYRCQPDPYSEKSYCSSACQGADWCSTAQKCNVATGICERLSCASASCPDGMYCNASNECLYKQCTDNAQCKEGFTCSTTSFACEPTRCTGQAAGECPSSFVCDTAQQTCVRLSCNCDTECPAGGYCIQSQCFPTAGHCDGGCAIGRPLIDSTGEALVAQLLRGLSAGSGWR